MQLLFIIFLAVDSQRLIFILRFTECCCGELYRICPALLSSKYLHTNAGSMQGTLWVEETPLGANIFQENMGFGSKWREGFYCRVVAVQISSQYVESVMKAWLMPLLWGQRIAWGCIQVQWGASSSPLGN